MAKLSTNDGTRLLNPREDMFVTGVLGSLNSEVVVAADGASTVSLDLRGTFNMTVEVSGTVDGVNWTLIPMRPINVASVSYVATIAGTVAGVWVGACAAFRLVRARVTAYTSGSAVTYLTANNGLLDPNLQSMVTPLVVTNTGAASAAVTLSLPTPGAGLRQYLTYLAINRFAAATLTPAATPVLVTTANLPGALVFSLPADAAAQGVLTPWREDFAYPLAASAQSTATTIVCPATTGVIWRVTAGYYAAP
jgi:hypothetical protein